MTFKKRILSRCMVTMFIMGMISLSACGKNEGRSDEKSEPEPSLTIDQSEEDADKHDLAISPDKSDDPNVSISDAIEKEEFEAFIFSNDDDRQYLSPDSEDYRILYYELPAVTVFPEWTVKQNLAGDLYFAGNSHGEGNRTCTAWVIDVMSFDESGHMISEKQKLWVEKENDAVSLACSEKVCVYFFEHETGSNSIPEDFDPEATAKYCMDTILSRDVGEWYSDLEYVKRIGSSFYAKTNADGYAVSLLANHVAFADVPVRPDILAADRVDSEGFVRESINYSYQRDYFTDTQHIIYMDYAEAECIVFYSMPDKHKKNLVKGNREHFDGSYPQAAIDDGFVPEEKDAEYLAPPTDDYFLYYTVNSEHEHNERTVLLSFDEKGDPVDLILRNYKYTINPEVVIAHYQDQGGKILYEDENLYYVQMPVDPNAYLALGVFDEYAKDTKIKHMSDFSQQGGINVPCNAFMPDAHAYMNDPGLSPDMMIIPDGKLTDLDMEKYSLYIDLLTDDYIILKRTDKNDQSEDEAYWYFICFYDEDGNIMETGYTIYGFDSASVAEEYYDYNVENEKEYFEPDDLILLDNEIIMKATKIPDQPVFRLTKAGVIERLVTGIGLVMDPSFDELYLSMPYLTDRQSEVYEENYWN